MSRPWLYIFIGLIATLVFYFSNANLRGYLRCDSCLGKEIQSPADSLYKYKLSNKPPFKYRLLFPSIVKASHKIVFGEFDSLGFYYTYKFWSWFFYVSASCLIFYLMIMAGFNDRLSFIGGIIFIFLPPMLMAYSLPVHTREDPLGYTILLLGLITLIKEKRILFLLISVAGVLCRETLLLLPMLYFFFADDKIILRRFAIPAMPCIVWVALRLSLGHEQYDVTEGFRWNNNNLSQVVGFLFITFNICWITFIFYVLEFRDRLKTPNKVRRFFYRSVILTLVVILLTTYFGGIYNEIRLLYLLAPWMILLLLDFVEHQGTKINEIVITKWYVGFIILATVASGLLMYFILKYQDSLIIPGKFAVPYHLWIIISVFYIYLTIIFLPVSVKIFSAKRGKNV